MANYVDDTNPPIWGDNTTEVIINLFVIAQKVFTQFANNKMKANHDNCQLLFHKDNSVSIHDNNIHGLAIEMYEGCVAQGQQLAIRN